MRFSTVRGLKDILTARTTVAAIAEIGFDPRRTLIWSYYPDALRIFSRFPQSCSVYWTGDEVLDPKEPELLRRVDHVFALSPDTVAQKRLVVEEKVSAMPMAIDPRPFVLARAAGDRPSDLQRLRRPLVGYGGAFNERIDWRILHEIADRTIGTLALVGPIVDGEGAREVKSLTEKPTVVWLGHRGADEAPHYLAAFDAALIPYKRNRFNDGSNPVKFYEYLAAGLPVVSVKLPALSGFDDVAVFVDDPSEFAKIANVAAEQRPDPAAVKRRQKVALEHSYERLIARIEDRISCGGCFAD
jgi:glycosyltransferase involved in cell wall biosynthesis